MSRADLLNENTRKCRVCITCGKRIPLSQSHDQCNDCLKRTIFPAVREYVRKNDVNELEIAEHFNLTREMVHEWVVEGALEYKNMP